MMKQITLEMSSVLSCAIEPCAYNMEKRCHAKAITIGDGTHAGCDTFISSQIHSVRLRSAGVGACKVRHCIYNGDFECTAENIEVGRRNSDISCLTFEKRR